MCWWRPGYLQDARRVRRDTNAVRQCNSQGAGTRGLRCVWRASRGHSARRRITPRPVEQGDWRVTPMDTVYLSSEVEELPTATTYPANVRQAREQYRTRHGEHPSARSQDERRWEGGKGKGRGGKGKNSTRQGTVASADQDVEKEEPGGEGRVRTNIST